MDPYTLAYLAGHSDFATMKPYVHPQADTVRGAKGGHSDAKAAETPSVPGAVRMNDFSGLSGRGEWIRTTDLLVPNQAL